MSSSPEVDICICTYRRDSIVLTLQSVAAQARTGMRVIIADNDETPSAKALVEAEAARLKLLCLYVHAPARNISLARNACLAAATAPLIAFLDDDEVASEDWLSALVSTLEARGADVAFGPVIAQYEADAPGWLKAGDFHSTRVVVLPGGAVQTGYAGNCLMRADAIAGERFDLALGVSGGEDTEFFHRLYLKGLRLIEAPEALAFEPVPPTRQTLGWLLRRSFRAGQTHARTLMAAGRGPVRAALIASLKAAYCFGLAILLAWRPVEARRALVRGALHAGVVARLTGVRDVLIYGSKPH